MPQISENIIRRVEGIGQEFSNSTVLYLEFCVASINKVNKNPLNSKNTFYNKGQGPKH